MPAMHKEVHERTGEKHQDGQRHRDMRTMPDDQIGSDCNGGREKEYPARLSKAFEHHEYSFVVSIAMFRSMTIIPLANNDPTTASVRQPFQKNFEDSTR